MKKSMRLCALLLGVIVLIGGLAAACASNKKTTDNAHLHADSTMLKYFSNQQGCKISGKRAGREGYAIQLETLDATEDPFVHFYYENYMAELEMEPVKADEYKYVIIKMKAENCSNTDFELFCFAGDITGAAGGYSRTAVFDNLTSGWQYLCFDMSGCNLSGTLHGMRIDFMRTALKGGEKVYIAAFTLLKTAQEVSAFLSAEAGTGHGVTEKEQARADALLASVTLEEPENVAIPAEHEDAGLQLWFDHMYTKTPAESTETTGKNTYKMYLAKNEIEDCQFLLAAADGRENLTAEISAFKNASGDTLRTELYYGYYFEDVQGQAIADPMPPLTEPFSLTAGRSQLFVIKLFTEADSKAGDYEATLRILDAEGNEIKKAKVYAYVYDFELPEATTCKTQMDLSWWAIYVNHECWEGDDGLLYKKYYDLMLENRICAYTLPYSDNGQYADERVQEYVANPRVVAFNPLGWKVDPTAENISAAYKYLSQNQEWLDKAYFYVVDEPLTMDQFERIDTVGKLISDNFPGYHYFVPIHYNMALNEDSTMDFFSRVETYINSWCPHTFFYNTYEDYRMNPLLTYRCTPLIDKNLGSFPERMAAKQAAGQDVWWYVTRYPQSPEITVSIETQAVKYRILFWQQKLYNVDHFLYYLVNDWFPATVDGQSDFGFNSKHEVEQGGITPFDIYGNGVLLYSGHYLGIEEPIGSLRMECIRDGIEDFEYLTMLEDLCGREEAELIIRQLTTSLGEYNADEELFTRLRCVLGKLVEINS